MKDYSTYDPFFIDSMKHKYSIYGKEFNDRYGEGSAYAEYIDIALRDNFMALEIISRDTLIKMNDTLSVRITLLPDAITFVEFKLL